MKKASLFGLPHAGSPWVPVQPLRREPQVFRYPFELRLEPEREWRELSRLVFDRISSSCGFRELNPTNAREKKMKKRKKEQVEGSETP